MGFEGGLSQGLGEGCLARLSKRSLALDSDGPHILMSDPEALEPQPALVEISALKGCVGTLTVSTHDVDISLFVL